MDLVLDATPLIYLAKSGFYKYFSKLEVKLWTTGEIIRELRLEEGDYPENHIISNLIKEEIVEVVDPKKTMKVVGSIHKGEASIISMARKKGLIAVMDDKAAKVYAETLGIKTVHSTFLIFLALRNGLVTKKKARDLVDAMIDAGWRCDVETYKEILRAIEEAGTE